MHKFLFLILLSLACRPIMPAGEWEVILTQPRITIDQREGITGGGLAVIAGDNRVLSFFPDHPDDFGGSKGMASALSTDGGLTWAKGSDNWPMSGMVDIWADRLGNGDLIAFGIHWLPDPKNRRSPTPPEVPADAYQIGISQDEGQTWKLSPSTIHCPPEIGYIARPLPHIVENQTGELLMPAYTWSHRGNRAVLLQSTDRGKNWEVRSVITTAVAMLEAGAKVSTPWLEATVSPTKNAETLAVVRTGSNVGSKLVSVRSTDGGKTWSAPQVLSMPGKLPTLHLLKNGVITLTTALSGNHCRVYLSEDGTGREWSDPFVISSLTGGNVGAAKAGDNQLLLTSSAPRRIDAWHVQIARPPQPTADLKSPSDIEFEKGELRWSPTPNAAGYRITPVLLEFGSDDASAPIPSYAPIHCDGEETRLPLSRQLLPGRDYVFDVAALDEDGRISKTVRSSTFQP